MKLVLCTVQSQYVDIVDDIFGEHGVCDWVRHPRAEGRDQDGRHRGGKVFPGNLASFFALVPTDHIAPLLDALRRFRDAREAHAHLRAVVLTPDQVL
jgi:hypothetical protein